MKASPSLLKALRWLVLFWVCSGAAALGQNSQFGSSHVINGTTYNWDSGSDDGTYHTDTYLDGSGGTATIRGRLGYPNLGEVSATSGTNSFTGFYQWGSISPLNVTYTNTPSYTSATGKSYDWVSGDATYAVDLNAGAINTVSYTETYSGPGGSFTVSVSGGNGGFSGSESGYVVGGTWYMDSSSTSTWELGQGPSFAWLGVTYFQTASYTGTTYDSSGNSSLSDYYTYGSLDNGTISESYYYPDESSWPVYSTGGWDPYVGSWSLLNGSTLTSPQFADRSAPKFVAGQVLWVNGTLVNWTRSEITANGGITDTFGDAGGIQVVISGNARAYDTEGAAASVSVSVPGTGQNHSGTVTAGGGFSGFDPQTVDLQISDPNRATPLFTVATLWVDGTPFAFAGGYEDSAGNRTDRYEHTSGSLRLTGQVADATTAAVVLTVGAEILAGTFASGELTVPGHIILTQALVEGPPAFWVAGAFYLRGANTNTYTTANAPVHSLSLGGEDSASLALSGTHAAGAVGGTYNAQLSGVFNVTVNGSGGIACPAEADGGLRPGPGAAALPAGFPSAVQVSGASWDFLGTTLDDGGAGVVVACYGNAQVVPDGAGYWTDNLWLLKMETGGSGPTKTVTLTDYHENTRASGSYDTGSHLFQTVWTTNPAEPPPLPMPVLPLDAMNDAYALWLVPPPAGSGLPPSFLVRGQPWRLAAYDAGTDKATYQGFYAGQTMTLGAADASGQRAVALTDALHNNGATTQGTLSGERRSVRLRDGTLALSGNEQGTQAVVQHVDQFKLHTIAADLDLVGNNLSFGILEGDASLAGALFQFADVGGAATLQSSLSRTQARWLWNRAADSTMQTTLPVMQLDALHRLTLHDPGSGAAGVVLNPAEGGVSTLRGVLRVRPGGDIGMGEFMAGGEP